MGPGVATKIDESELAARAEVLYGVLYLLAGLLEVALRLIGLTLGFHLTVARGPPDAFLGLALEFLSLVPGLVAFSHFCLLGLGV
jgi:hypothetical protein